MKRSAHSFRVRVSVAQTLDDACVDGTFSARRAETPDAWRRFNHGQAGVSRRHREEVATKPQNTTKPGNCVVSSPCSRAASASPSPNRPKKHSRHPRKLGALPVPHRRLPRAQLRGDVDHHHRRSAVVDAVVCHRAGDQLPQRSLAVAGHRDARGVRRGGHLADELANLGACGVVRGDCDDWGGCIRVLGLTLKKK